MKAESFIVEMLAATPDQRIEGKKRLQKFAYLLKSAGAPLEATFALRNFGPFSTEIDSAATMLSLFGGISESEQATGANGYLTTVYSLPVGSPTPQQLDRKFVDLLGKLDNFSTLELEMASTVHYFIQQDNDYSEAVRLTREMKPSKSSDRIFERAKAVLELTS